MNGGECYLYDPNYCDGDVCVGNCDNCSITDLMLGEERGIEQSVCFKNTTQGKILAQSLVELFKEQGCHYEVEETEQSVIVKWGANNGID